MLSTLLEPYHRWRRMAQARPRFQQAERIAIGVSGVAQPSGWLGTERGLLDVTDRSTFARWWVPGTVRVFLAEHVWEHLTQEQARAGIRNCYEYLRPGGRLRLAVPDGHFPDPAYIEYVRPGGTGAGADDHKVLWTRETLGKLMEEAGFEVHALEYWDGDGTFHAEEWSSEDGHVARSKNHDHRNQDGTLRYTSLIVDGLKPSASA